MKTCKESIQVNMSAFYKKATENIDELNAKLADRNSAITELGEKLKGAEGKIKSCEFLNTENQQLIEFRSFHQAEYERLRQQLHDEMARVEQLTERNKSLETQLEHLKDIKKESHLQDQRVIEELKQHYFDYSSRVQIQQAHLIEAKLREKKKQKKED